MDRKCARMDREMRMNGERNVDASEGLASKPSDLSWSGC